MRILLVAALLLAVLAPSASAASAKWRTCVKAPAEAAAEAAGLPAAMDADEDLRRIFGEQPPSETFVLGRALCADYDRDGYGDIAVH